jgi:uncharacterized protein
MTQNPETSGVIGPDLVLMLLAASNEATGGANRLDGITRLEKLLFLADQETDLRKHVEDPFSFHAYDYGPYSKEVYEAVELLEQAGLLSEQRVFEEQAFDDVEEWAAVATNREGVERRFSLTDNGRAVANLLTKRNPHVARDLADVKGRYASMPLRQLLRYVYTRYPRFAVKSKIRDEIM